jgi:AraC-like DNA-binding protein
MHADPARRWTVAELAAAAGLSRSAFARRFTTLTGRPPLAYLSWWRMTLAARLLRQTDAPLSSLARQTGYTSEYAFANAFKRECGIAPGRYRTMPQPALAAGTIQSDQVLPPGGRPSAAAASAAAASAADAAACAPARRPEKTQSASDSPLT